MKNYSEKEFNPETHTIEDVIQEASVALIKNKRAVSQLLDINNFLVLERNLLIFLNGFYSSILCANENRVEMMNIQHKQMRQCVDDIISVNEAFVKLPVNNDKMN